MMFSSKVPQGANNRPKKQTVTHYSVNMFFLQCFSAGFDLLGEAPLAVLTAGIGSDGQDG